MKIGKKMIATNTKPTHQETVANAISFWTKQAAYWRERGNLNKAEVCEQEIAAYKKELRK